MEDNVSRKLLEDLKRRAESSVKEYVDAVKKENVMYFDNWLITYVKEDTLIGVQKTLAVSHKTGKCFDESNLVKDYPVLFQVFNKCSAGFIKTYPGRGFTLLYVW